MGDRTIPVSILFPAHEFQRLLSGDTASIAGARDQILLTPFTPIIPDIVLMPNLLKIPCILNYASGYLQRTPSIL